MQQRDATAGIQHPAASIDESVAFVEWDYSPLQDVMGFAAAGLREIDQNPEFVDRAGLLRGLIKGLVVLTEAAIPPSHMERALRISPSPSPLALLTVELLSHHAADPIPGQSNARPGSEDLHATRDDVMDSDALAMLPPAEAMLLTSLSAPRSCNESGDVGARAAAAGAVIVPLVTSLIAAAWSLRTPPADEVERHADGTTTSTTADDHDGLQEDLRSVVAAVQLAVGWCFVVGNHAAAVATVALLPEACFARNKRPVSPLWLMEPYRFAMRVLCGGTSTGLPGRCLGALGLAIRDIDAEDQGTAPVGDAWRMRVPEVRFAALIRAVSKVAGAHDGLVSHWALQSAGAAAAHSSSAADEKPSFFALLSAPLVSAHAGNFFHVVAERNFTGAMRVALRDAEQALRSSWAMREGNSAAAGGPPEEGSASRVTPGLLCHALAGPINAHDATGVTPLGLAIIRWNPIGVRLLLLHGASPRQPTTRGLLGDAPRSRGSAKPEATPPLDLAAAITAPDAVTSMLRSVLQNPIVTASTSADDNVTEAADHVGEAALDGTSKGGNELGGAAGVDDEDGSAVPCRFENMAVVFPLGSMNETDAAAATALRSRSILSSSVNGTVVGDGETSAVSAAAPQSYSIKEALDNVEVPAAGAMVLGALATQLVRRCGGANRVPAGKAAGQVVALCLTALEHDPWNNEAAGLLVDVTAAAARRTASGEVSGSLAGASAAAAFARAAATDLAGDGHHSHGGVIGATTSRSFDDRREVESRTAGSVSGESNAHHRPFADFAETDSDTGSLPSDDGHSRSFAATAKRTASVRSMSKASRQHRSPARSTTTNSRHGPLGGIRQPSRPQASCVRIADGTWRVLVDFPLDGIARDSKAANSHNNTAPLWVALPRQFGNPNVATHGFVAEGVAFGSPWRPGDLVYFRSERESIQTTNAKGLDDQGDDSIAAAGGSGSCRRVYSGRASDFGEVSVADEEGRPSILFAARIPAPIVIEDPAAPLSCVSALTVVHQAGTTAGTGREEREWSAMRERLRRIAELRGFASVSEKPPRTASAADVAVPVPHCGTRVWVRERRDVGTAARDALLSGTPAADGSAVPVEVAWAPETASLPVLSVKSMVPTPTLWLHRATGLLCV